MDIERILFDLIAMKISVANEARLMILIIDGLVI